MNVFKKITHSIGAKLSTGNFVLISAVFTVFIALVSYFVAQKIEFTENTNVEEKTKLLTSIVTLSENDLNMRVELLAKSFQNSLSGVWTVSSEKDEAVDQTTVHSALRLNDKSLTLEQIDKFSNVTGTVATVFEKRGDEFVRVATSLKNEKGERTLGTKLAPDHPGYAATLKGEHYVGLATLFGKQYITSYEPLKDEKGQLIGLTFVGLDFTTQMNMLKKTIRELKIGKTGYFYVLDTSPGKSYGNLIIHPSIEGKNMLAAKDANGNEFIKTMLDTKTGTIRYPWANKDETTAREKIVTFMHFKNWNWIIAGGTYVDEYTQEVKELRNMFILTGVVIVCLLSFLMYALVRHMVTKPLAIVIEDAALIARGDLRTTLRDTSHDEMGQLMLAMNKIGDGLSQVVQSVRTGSESVSVASAEIAQGQNDLSTRTEQEASAIEETSSALNELGSTVNQNAQRAQDANQLAQSASTVAIKGGEVVNSVISTMHNITTASHKIADIISVIDGIAFQTNILALNAAVEAARAGEQGRGFAVVASEVRSLAGRSAEAAKEIKTLIDANVSSVRQGTVLVNNAGVTMTEVVTSIRRVTDIMSEISTASAEQASSVGQIIEAVQHMDQSTQQNAALVEEMAAASSSLKDQANELVKTVAVFQVHEAN